VARVTAEVVSQTGAAESVGVTLPSVVRHGIVETAANIDDRWIGIDAHELFARHLNAPVVVMNDADAAGLAEVRFGAGAGVPGTVVVVTFGTGIGSAVFVHGELVPNTELGHLLLAEGEAELWAADSVRERDDLSWKKWAHRVQEYLAHLEALLWPELIVVGGGVSKHADKFLPRITLRTPVVPARLLNNAGIVGAAVLAAEAPPTLAA
jgi:polyphosphate glucokinase